MKKMTVLLVAINCIYFVFAQKSVTSRLVDEQEQAIGNTKDVLRYIPSVWVWGDVLP